MTDLTSLSPAEIDTELYKIEAEYGKAYAQAASAHQAFQRRHDEYYAQLAAKSEAKMVELKEQAEPLEAEFERRGGWTRAFLVVGNGKGHVHRTMDCSTCNNGRYATQFYWMTDYSDHNEQEIVDAAGERACTVCYASAPVALRLDRPTQMFSEDEKEAQRKREEKEAKRVAAKAQEIVVPRVKRGVHVYKTERGATNALAQALDSVLYYGKHDLNQADIFLDDASVIATVEAIAAKRGVDASEVYAEAAKKAEKKANANYRTRTLPTWAVATKEA